MKEIAKIFLGEHDFSNFARMEGKDSSRTIDSIDISRANGLLALDFKAQSFLWHMIRRIMSAIIDTCTGKISLDEIKTGLSATQKMDFGIAPPEPLILMDVVYDFDFEVNVMNLARIEQSCEKIRRRLRMEDIFYREMLKNCRLV